MTRPRRLLWAVVLVALLPTARATVTGASAPVAAAGDPRIMAAGDIACEPGDAVTSYRCRQHAVSDILVNAAPTAVLTLGDNQYEEASLWEYNRSYDPSWGRVKYKTRPTAGNHEYRTWKARGYFDYFGTRAGHPDRGYYSFNIGYWHLIALNSNIARDAYSPQVAWLRADLADNSKKCTLAFWHHPRFSSGEHGSYSSVKPFWNELYRAGADVVLNGHDHNYERFAPQTPGGALDYERGIRQFVVGTGSKSQHGFETIKANSQVRKFGVFGVLELTLHAAGYHWRFVPEAGKTFSDSGWAPCH